MKYFIIIFAFVCIIVWILIITQNGHIMLGGGNIWQQQKKHSKHIVIDTLNLTHWWINTAQLKQKDIIQTIEDTAPILRKKYSGRIMYVIKDRESLQNTIPPEIYQGLAVKYKIFIYVAEKYTTPAPSGNKKDPTIHASKGRDDLLMSIIANKFSCMVLTNDALRDFKMFKIAVPPFVVSIYSYWRKSERETIRPSLESYKLLRKPTIMFFKNILQSKIMCHPYSFDNSAHGGLRSSKCVEQ